MSEMKPTPGPWITHREGFSTIYIQSSIGGGWVQEIAACGPTNDGSAQQEANARLIAEAGTVFHNTGLSPVQLVEMVQELKAALRKYEDVREDMFTFFLSNGIFNQWGKRYDCSALNNAHLQASAALAKCEGVKP
jgi:hypothetical protein